MFLVNDFIALLAANLILTQALGTSTIFIASGSRRKLVFTTLVITLFTTFGAAAAYAVDRLLPSQYNYLTLLCYTAAVSALYVIFLVLFYYISKERFQKIRRYIHISAFNCAVMGTLFTISGRASEDPALMNIGSYVFAGLEAGVGFVLAALILSAAFHKLNSAKVPASFRGFPAMLVYLGIISMAVWALK
ncbi:MAG: hypothetical protein J6M48_05645 [Ruminococcus sp.]|nr:hypothetical protein [Ruminococcus sp.]